FHLSSTGDIINNGTIDFQNTSVTILGSLGVFTNNGTITVQNQKGEIQGYTVNNKGNILIGDVEADAWVNNYEGATLTALNDFESSDAANYGTLVVHKEEGTARLSVANNIRNFASGSLTADLVDTMHIENYGQFVATQVAATQYVHNIGENSILNATALATADLSNEGTFEVADLASSGNAVNSNQLIISDAFSSGSLSNSGTVQASGASVRVASTLSNTSEIAIITADTLTAQNINQNAGFRTASNIEVSGSLTNSKNITATEELVAGSLENNINGTVSATDATINVLHALNNSGEISAFNLNAGQIINSNNLEINSALTAQSIEENSGILTASTVNVTGNVNNSSSLGATNSLSAGSLLNTGELSTQTMQVIGDITNTGLSSAIKAKSVTASSISSNEGSLEATTINILGDASNSGRLTADRNFLVEGLVNFESGVVSAQFIEVSGGFENLGTIETDVLYTLEEGTNRGEISAKEYFTRGDFSNESSGSLTISGELTVEAKLTNFGKVEVKGATIVTDSLINSGTMDLTYVELEKGATLKNSGESDSFAEMTHLMAEEGSSIFADAGNVIVDSLSADNVTYYQTGGNFEVDKGWFTNSTLYVYGGTLDDSHNSTQSLGANTIYIKGDMAYGSASPEDENANKGLTSVIASEVTSETTIDIESGGILIANSLDLDGETQHSITLENGGALQVKAHEFFDGVGGQVFYLNALDPSGTTYIESEVVGATSVGSVKDPVAVGVDIQSGGNLVVSDKYYASSLIGSVLSAMANAYENADEINVVFLGTITSEFNVDSVEQLQNEDLVAVKNPGVVLSGVTLNNTTAANGDSFSKLVVGTDEEQSDANHFSTSMGFKDIANANEVSIVNGKELALVGSATGEGESFDDAEHRLLMDSNDGGSVSVQDGSFTLGSHGTVDGTAGWVNSVALDEPGALNIKNGEFGVWTISNEGNVNIASNATLHTNSLTGPGSTVNNGVLYIEKHGDTSLISLVEADTEESGEEEDQTSPQFVVGEAGFTNSEGSKLYATDVETTQVNGPLSNAGSAYYNDMVIVSNASSTNTGYEKGQWLTVEGTHTNSGTSVWNSVTISKDATESNTGNLTVENAFAVDGTLTNGKNGTIDASTVPETQLAGTINNEGSIRYGDLAIQAGALDSNKGYETGGALNIAEGGTHTNTGTSEWKSLVVASNGIENNKGNLTVQNDFAINGTLNNDKEGEIDASSVKQTQLAGTINNDGSIHYGNLDIQEGAVNNNQGSENGGTLHIAEGGTENNTGTSVWDKLEMAGGTLNSTGSMTIGNLVMDDGTINFGGANLVVNGDTTLNGGSIVVGNNKELSSDNAVHVELNPSGSVDTNIYVGGNGDLGLGKDSLTWADSIGAPNVPETSSRLVVTTPVATGSGCIAVGSNVYSDATNHVDLGQGDLYFGSGSTTVVDAAIMTDGSSAFTSTADASKITVE
ncbi:MAG: hypothetical protein LUC43_00170, partial [Burkholderiales bacterium]|nr:hypothetical protein [Burkholderiales bacterium]